MLRRCFTRLGVPRSGRGLFATAAAARKGSPNGIKEQPMVHPKTILTSLCAKLNWKPPEFEYTHTGPHHQPKFCARVKLITGISNGDVLEFTSSSYSKKTQAMFEASLAACEELKKRGILVDHSLATSLESISSSEPIKPPVETTSAKIPIDDVSQLVERHPHLSRLKQHPKSALQKLNSFVKTSNKDYREPKAHFHMMLDGTWTCRLAVTWPATLEFHARASSKSKAEHAAYLKYLQQLRLGGYFDDDWQPKFHSRRELRDFEKGRQTRVHFSAIPDELRVQLDEIKASAQELETEIRTLLTQSVDSSPESTMGSIEEDLEDETEAELGDGTQPAPIDKTPAIHDEAQTSLVDIITGRPWTPLDEGRFMERSHDLYSRYQRNKKRESESPSGLLPISGKRKEIVDLMEKNRVVIIAGGTGCGKTTQVPRFIFDDYVQRLRGAECNILITQPRRISAIGVAQRVAAERYERLGDTVGYQVRLSMRAPVGHGSMLFATPALILKKLWDNPALEGISHVIIDEVHERDLWTDFLLIILKRALKANPKLKIVLMSASMDSEKLSAYFESCPMVSVEGRNYEVQEHFMDDESGDDSSYSKGATFEPPTTDHQAVVDILSFVHDNRQEGAILCFLPSWTDITKIRKLFQERHEGRTDYAIYACHSRLPLKEQEKIFEPSPQGVRKIVLATNIAETSITINDVRYVVNTGTRKNSISDKNLRSIRQEWASQSSQIQRRGRAGRVSDGECFHLFSKSMFERMRPFDLPSMVKEPLENVVLFSKLCCPKEDPKALLEEALDKPPVSQIDNAVQVLTDMRLLDVKRELTTLGSHVAKIGCHPMLGLAMVYGAVYKCIEPLVTLTSILQTEGLVQTMSQDQEGRPAGNLEREAKERFVDATMSDHLAQVNLFTAYQQAVAEGKAEEFITEHCLRVASLEQSQALRRLFAWELSEIGLCGSVDECLDPANALNANAGKSDLVKAVLAAGLHGQAIWLGKGIVRRGRILEQKEALVDEDGRIYTTPGSSLFKLRALSKRDYSDQIFVYVNKLLVGGTSKMFRVDGLSAVNPVATVLYGGHDPVPLGDGVVNLTGPRYQLCMAKEDAVRLLETRKLIRQVVDWALETKALKRNDDASGALEKLSAITDRLTCSIIDLIAKTSIERERSRGLDDIPLDSR